MLKLKLKLESSDFGVRTTCIPLNLFFPLSTSHQRSWQPFNIFQPNIAIQAWFISSSFFKPNTHTFFSFVMFFQSIAWYFFSFSFSPHMNFRWSQWNSSKHAVGVLAAIIWYIGNASKILFDSVTLLAKDGWFPF